MRRHHREPDGRGLKSKPAGGEHPHATSAVPRRYEVRGQPRRTHVDSRVAVDGGRNGERLEPSNGPPAAFGVGVWHLHVRGQQRVVALGAVCRVERVQLNHVHVPRRAARKVKLHPLRVAIGGRVGAPALPPAREALRAETQRGDETLEPGGSGRRRHRRCSEAHGRALRIVLEPHAAAVDQMGSGPPAVWILGARRDARNLNPKEAGGRVNVRACKRRSQGVRGGNARRHSRSDAIDG